MLYEVITGALRQAEVPPRPQQQQQQRPQPQVAPAQTQATQARRQEAEVVPQAVMDEIRSLRKIVEQHLAGFAWGETARSEPVKTEVLRQMLDSGFSPQMARDLLADLPLV